MSASDVLFDQEEQPKKKERIDIEFEKTLINCAIGCLINDIAMDETDYVRLYLAFFRVGGVR